RRSQEPLTILVGRCTPEPSPYPDQSNEVEGLTFAPGPSQNPPPPVHLAVSRTAASVDVAVGRDLPILTSFFTPQDDTLGLIRLYGERCAATGKSSRLADMPFFRFVYLSQDEKEVVGYPQEAITWVRDLSTYRRTITQGDEINVNLEHWKTVRPEAPPSYESELVHNLYFCTPDRCVERIAALQSQHGIEYFGAAFSFGTMAHAQVMASMQLFAE